MGGHKINCGKLQIRIGPNLQVSQKHFLGKEVAKTVIMVITSEAFVSMTQHPREAIRHLGYFRDGNNASELTLLIKHP